MSGEPDVTEIYNRQQDRVSDMPTEPASVAYSDEDVEYEAPDGRVGVASGGFAWRGKLVLSNTLRRLSEFNVSILNESHVRYAVASLGETEDEYDDEAVAELAKALRKRAANLSRRVAESLEERGGVPTDVVELQSFGRDGMLLFDAVFFDLLEETGPRGSGAARKGRQKSRDRWELLQSDNEGVSTRKLFKLWQPVDDLPEQEIDNPNFPPMVVEFLRPYDRWEAGDTAEFYNPGVVRSLCGTKEDHADDQEPYAEQIGGPDPGDVVPQPWHEDGPARLDRLSIIRAFSALTGVLWDDQVREDWKRLRERGSVSLTGTRYGDQGDAFAKLDKTAGAVPSKGKLTRQTDEGAQPVDVDGAGDLEIDDESFANAPGVLRMIPQQWGVARDDDNPDPSTTQLPLGIDPEREGASVAFRLFADSQVQLKPTAAKIVVGLHLLSPQTGGLGSVELGELTEWVNQGKSRPAQKRNRRKVRDNLIAARTLGVPPNLDGTGHNIQMFEVHPPDNLDKGAEVVFGHTRGFEGFLRKIEDGEGPFGQLRGEFVVNADGFMRISGNDSDAARMYLALCAMWNDHNWDPDRLPFRRIDELARRANQLSEQARLVLDEGGGDREQLWQGRHQTKKAVEKLADEYELVGDLEVKGAEGSRELKILPNGRHREAWAHLRNNRDQRLDLDEST